MAWTARKRAQIRDEYLADLAARFELAGTPIDVREGSFDFRVGECLALIAESQELQAQNNTNEILPDKASEAGVVRHGFCDGVDREEATKAVLAVTVTGTASATVPFGSSRLVSPAGLSYTVSASADGTGTSVALSGGGTATAYAKCQTAGTDGNLADGTILSWSNTPANANPTVAVVSTDTSAQDQESKDDYAKRILDRRQERPGGANRADLRAWAQSVDGTYEAFVHSLWHQTYGPNTRGAVTIVVVGTPRGSTFGNTRVVSGTAISWVDGYIEGTHDIHGDPVTNGVQLRPASLPSGSYVTLPAVPVDVDVTVVLTMASDAPFPWTSPASYTVTAWNPTTREITLSADPVEVTEGDTVGVRDTAAVGMYSYGKVASVNHGANKITMESGFLPASVDIAATGRIRPAPPNATSILAAIIGYFDKLTPGDTSPASRWPIINSDRPSILYRPALVADAIALSGGSVLSGSVTLPASDQTPAPRELYALRELILSP